MVPDRITILPRFKATLEPETATGTTGTCAWMAITKPPFLNGSMSPVRLRVPSGKMMNERPDITWYKVEAENQESIHNHNAYACIEKG